MRSDQPNEERVQQLTRTHEEIRKKYMSSRKEISKTTKKLYSLGAKAKEEKRQLIDIERNLAQIWSSKETPEIDAFKALLLLLKQHLSEAETMKPLEKLLPYFKELAGEEKLMDLSLDKLREISQILKDSKVSR